MRFALAGLALEALAPAVELGVLFLANAAATALRHLLLRIWVFGPGQGAGQLQGWAPCPPRPSTTRRA
ncbi:MAG TPA: hypothetical protein VMS11_14375 [Solirubrobacterales bacterium]|nr:hypothetical protein [Solirubrobacterales bacterium]